MASRFYSAKEKLEKDTLLKLIAEARRVQGKSILHFNFKKSRCRVLSQTQEIKPESSGVLYWMNRDCRVQDNWAMLFAQRLALKHKLPLLVCFFAGDCSLYPTRRHFKFLIDGLKFVKNECKELNISFHLISSKPIQVVEIVEKNNIGCVITEFFPLKQPQGWKEKILKKLPKDVSLVEVDAHNIVPVWLASEKQEVAARTIRSKIVKKLPEFMTGFPAVSKHPHQKMFKIENEIGDYDEFVDGTKFEKEVNEVEWAKPGTETGLEMLQSFINDRLKFYNERNDPSKDATSNLSPWLHFGQISAERCALEVKNFQKSYKEQCENFLEELIVRRELSDNFCFYNPNYDNFKGADAWARKTLDEHRQDKRTYVYTRKQFEKAETHDNIWNCAQIQLNQTGKMHGYMRMYWCKKVLEWTETPEKAVEIALYLNDTYSLDGNDPNGFVGIMWSICGVHDHGWKEREIFGKIRFMVDYCLRNKFDVDSYCSKFGQTLKTDPKVRKGLKRKFK